MVEAAIVRLGYNRSNQPPFMAFWWVNHKQTYRQETDGGYIWSPKTNANGSPITSCGSLLVSALVQFSMSADSFSFKATPAPAATAESLQGSRSDRGAPP